MGLKSSSSGLKDSFTLCSRYNLVCGVFFHQDTLIRPRWSSLHCSMPYAKEWVGFFCLAFHFLCSWSLISFWGLFSHCVQSWLGSKYGWQPFHFQGWTGCMEIPSIRSSPSLPWWSWGQIHNLSMANCVLFPKILIFEGFEFICFTTISASQRQGFWMVSGILGLSKYFLNKCMNM